ncbi:Dihydrofolate reductase [Beutenbergia cavernae DSM 12333]|uniref:Dihydrofolate reductase n=1 Tax=Beutenbergia cavernae (strain ATCC BAA-8 / DSM 12333 / CCUG 43141 / JCM 11478 / NBRC 16432 / NCIMB 13614 / HKI 0122) TaxID=471853 RepID=C5BYZ5_BEUC1|nr:dihydrofolate reductase [Beutenbergia cavernae]ACQ81110.1 Dihydrofolate reductase [Beutenbergia cavernae DSM 12333]
MIGMIWAQAHDGVIGARGTVPWHVPEDFAHFKATTRGHAVVMGRATWDSLPDRYRPMPERRNVVVTRQVDWSADGAERAGSIPDALERCAAEPETWIMGGAQIYAEAMPYADTLVVTQLDLALDVEGAPDVVHAPPIGPEWRIATDTWDGTWQTSRTGVRWQVHQYVRA